MEFNRFERTFKSDMFAVKPIITETLDYIKYTIPSISEMNEYELKLIFSELLFNAVIHGNRMDGIRNVSIFLEIYDSNIYASVSDEGNGYDYMQHIKNFNSNENLTGESGRGIRLVYALTDRLEFNEQGNAIKFCKKVLCDG